MTLNKLVEIDNILILKFEVQVMKQARSLSLSKSLKLTGLEHRTSNRHRLASESTFHIMSSSALGPFMAIAGDSLAVKVYIVPSSTMLNANANVDEELTTLNATDTSSPHQYVVLLRKPEQESTVEITMYQLVVSNDDTKALNAERQLFSVSRHAPMEITLELLSNDPNVTSGQLRNRKNVTLLYLNSEAKTLKTILAGVTLPGFDFDQQDHVKVLESPKHCYQILFGSKFDTDIFQRSLEHHSERMSNANIVMDTTSALTAEESDKVKPKANVKGRRKRSSNGSVVVSLRRTSETNEQLAYEVIGLHVAPNKKRKASKASTSTKAEEPPSNFYFILPSDFDTLTDYYILLYSQVKRGIMTAADMGGNRKNAACLDTGVGFPGMRCRHCGGNKQGSYFPSSSKNLMACPPTLHTHLMKCSSCPDIIKRSLKLTKTKHKTDMTRIQPGAQTAFYNQFWKRIQEDSFNGEAHTEAVRERLELVVKECTPPPQPKKVKESRAREATVAKSDQIDIDRDDMIPSIVSYEELENDAIISQALSVDTNNANDSEPTEDDWEMALELLRRPPSPNSEIDLTNPPEAMNVSPNSIQNEVQFPLAVRVSDSGEMYHNGEFIISERYNMSLPNTISTPQKMSLNVNPMTSPNANQDDISTTRKFTRSDEINLIRGIMMYGKKWKAIWQATPALQHIYHAALKDRARSKRFKDIMARAVENPHLLNDPQALCGSEDQPEYNMENVGSPYSSNVSDISGDDCDESNDLKRNIQPFSPLAAIQRLRHLIDVPIEALVDRSPFQKR